MNKTLRWLPDLLLLSRRFARLLSALLTFCLKSRSIDVNGDDYYDDGGGDDDVDNKDYKESDDVETDENSKSGKMFGRGIHSMWRRIWKL